MNKREAQESNETLLNIYDGILFQAEAFEAGEEVAFAYHFDCPEFEQLKKTYPIERIAGKGSDFERALRLCRWLAPRLRHKGDYDNHVPCNALALMAYCFEKLETGINCMNKAKILAECCLALGIYARRLWMFPLSPYDMDNHVVTEVFDRKRNKWIILDPTTGGYFTDGESPLSALETRALYARHGQVSVVMNRQNPSDVEALMAKPGNLAYNAYYAKNFFRLCVETVSGFGKAEEARYFNLLPVGVNLQRQEAESMRYRIGQAKRYGMEEGLIREMEAHMARVQKEYKALLGTERMWDAPI